MNRIKIFLQRFLKNFRTITYYHESTRIVTRAFPPKLVIEPVQSLQSQIDESGCGGATILVPGGIHLIYKPIILRNNIRLVGVGGKCVTLGDYCIYGKNVKGCEIINLYIEGNDHSTAVYFEESPKQRLEDIKRCIIREKRYMSDRKDR